LGFAVALTGWMNAYDGDSTKMAKLWIDQTNAKGGLLGRKLKWVEADTKTDRTEGAKAGQAVIDQGAELVFVSCDYDFGAPAALQGQKAGVITVFLPLRFGSQGRGDRCRSAVLLGQQRSPNRGRNLG
jgi:branched-chain amino acid transport system substrate-binding protein